MTGLVTVVWVGPVMVRVREVAIELVFVVIWLVL